VTAPDDAAALDAELAELLSAHDLAGRLVDILDFELLTPARTLFGDRAVPWIASTLRTTADLLERLDPPGT
jgi:GMP synthase PP-ATPase subunit